MSLAYRSSPSFYTVERNGLKVVSVQRPSAASQPVFKQDGTRVQLKLESDFNEQETITLTYSSIDVPSEADAVSPMYSPESTFYPESENCWSKPGPATSPTYSIEKTAFSPAFTITVLPESSPYHGVGYSPMPAETTFSGVKSSPYHAVSYESTPPTPTFSEYESFDPEGVALSCFSDVMLDSSSVPIPEKNVTECQSSSPSYLDEMINTPESEEPEESSPRPMSNASAESVATAELLLPLHLVEMMEAQQTDDDVVSSTAPTPKKPKTEVSVMAELHSEEMMDAQQVNNDVVVVWSKAQSPKKPKTVLSTTAPTLKKPKTEVLSTAPTPTKAVVVMAELHSEQMIGAQLVDNDDDVVVVWSTVPTRKKSKTVLSSKALAPKKRKTAVSATAPTPKKPKTVVSPTWSIPKKVEIGTSSTAPTPKKSKTEVEEDLDWEWELETAVEIMRKLSEETGRELLERQEQQRRFALQSHLLEQEVLQQQFLMAQMRVYKGNPTLEQLKVYQGNPTLEQLMMYQGNPTLEQMRVYKGNPTLEQLKMYKGNPTLEQLKMYKGNPTLEQLKMYKGNPTLEQLKMYKGNPTLEQLNMYKMTNPSWSTTTAST